MRRTAWALPLALAACSTTEQSTTSLDPAEDIRVGAKQERICFQQNINAFREYGDGDGLLLRRGANTWYLLTLRGPCPALDFARVVGLSPDLTGAGCVRPVDRIFVSDGTRGPVGISASSCLIGDIYAFDPAAQTQEDDDADGGARQ